MNERGLSILELFSLEKPAWAADEISCELGTSVSTAYRLIALLEAGGLITAVKPGLYVLGPAIVQYDRQIQLTDPLLLASRPVMGELVAFAPPGSVMLLCRSYRETVLCVHQAQGQGMTAPVSYERGRPMPLFRGATSKIILAHAPTRLLRRTYDRYALEIAQSGLGTNWAEFKDRLAQLRKAAVAITHGEVDPGVVGLSVAILGDDGYAYGSLSYVLPEAAAEERLMARLITLLRAAVEEIQLSMKKAGQSS